MAWRLSIAGVGPRRAGTTWLHECLGRHPQLCVPAGVKETFFFDDRYDRGLDWYRSHFRDADGRRCAEIGPSYFAAPAAAERLRAHNPRCRIIITLRDPVARSHSLYLHHRRKGRVRGTFAGALRERPEILDSSRYRRHVPRWLDGFGRERVLVLLQEDAARDPAAVLRRVYRFCGLDAVPPPASAHRRVNRATLPRHPTLARLAARLSDWLRDRRIYAPIEVGKRLGLKRVFGGEPRPGMDPALRRELIAELEPDIAYVESLLGRALPDWRRSVRARSGAGAGAS